MSLWSWNSACSVASLESLSSVGSIRAVGSAGSIASIGSAGSILCYRSNEEILHHRGEPMTGAQVVRHVAVMSATGVLTAILVAAARRTVGRWAV